MDKEFSAIPDDIAERTLRYTKGEFERVLQQTEEYVREKPVQSIFYALLAGFILNQATDRANSRRDGASVIDRVQTRDFDLRRDQALSGIAERRLIFSICSGGL